MSQFTLKDYQQNALDALGEYFRLTHQLHDADTAFYHATRQNYGGKGLRYIPVEQLPGLPYVCIRIPTGGGKTVVACHAVGVAAQELLRQERSVVLWLVPTNTIKDQTLAALRDRQHPYRKALESGADSRIKVMDLGEALHVNRGALDGETCVIISTLAALRVEDMDGRKIYEENGALMSHFQSLPEELVAGLDAYDNGKPIPSLANVLHLRHPIVIMDEAHNARTELSFDTLARFSPSCIVEFTATPAQPPAPNPSNVLYRVSAYELKSADMIKLPIRLQTNTDWKDAIAATVAKRSELETAAIAERLNNGQYLRPIALLQAQPRSQRGDTLTVEIVQQRLKDVGVAPEQIAIETGQISEVRQWEDANKASIFDSSCPIRFIITVDKLREGWDCPFAYVLCSVRELGARTAVEQILGRILRMPGAVRKNHPDLNYAYAFITSQRFRDAAENLAEALVANGFTRFEAQGEVEPEQPGLGFETGLFAVPEKQHSPAERGERLHVPQLALLVDGELEPVEESHFLQREWRLTDYPATLSETEFSFKTPASEQGDIDITAQGSATIGAVREEYVSDLQKRLALLMPRDITSVNDLAMWLDRHIRHPDIISPQSVAFLLRLVDYLIDERGFALEELARHRMDLRDATAKKIAEYRQSVVKTAYQAILFGEESAHVEVSADRVFSFDPDRYPANALYQGPYDLPKHYYNAIGAMNDEEAQCAHLLASLESVDYWVRNLERRPDCAFWLQTSTDKFYPDFVARLKDDRVLAVEYKGGHLLNSPDTNEKRLLGKLWEAKSDGKCVFLMVGHDDFEAELRRVAS